MLTGQGLIGKLVWFMAEQLMGHRFTVSLDEEKRVCRAFVELYFCLDRLEQLSERASITFSESGVSICEVDLIMPSVNSLSQRLIENRLEIGFALEIVDPELALVLKQLHSWKYSFLLALSRGIEYDVDDQDSDSIEYLKPDPRILSIDMMEFARWIREKQPSSSYELNGLEWPQSILWYGEFEEAFRPAELELGNQEALREFRDILGEHGQLLAQASEKLRQLIAEKFKVSDILYVSRGMNRNI